jgi:hypothetical protein
MTLSQLLTLGYTAVSAIGVVLGLVLLRRVWRARVERHRQGLNGVVSLLILKRAVRYTLVSVALLMLMGVGLSVFLTEPPRWIASLLLVLQPIVLTGYIVFDWLSEHKVDELLRQHKEKHG